MGAEFSRAYAQVQDTLEAEGQKIGDRDKIIAAHALGLGAVLVSRNMREFARVPGLSVENWETQEHYPRLLNLTDPNLCVIAADLGPANSGVTIPAIRGEPRD